MEKKKIKDIVKNLKNNVISREIIEDVNSLFFSFFNINYEDIDYILVLGGNSIDRIQEAVKIYNQYKKPIILSGGYIRKSGIKECDIYKRYAREHGVLEKDILTEENSQNTYENIINSFQILINKKKPHLLVVSSVQHLYRISKTISKVSKELNFYPMCSYYPVPIPLVNSNNWYLSRIGKKGIIDELEKVIKYELL